MSISGHEFHILHIEDDPLHRELLALILSERGVRVTQAGTLTHAREYLEKQHFSLVVLDGNVPFEHGKPSESTVPFYINHLRGKLPVVAATCSPRIAQELKVLGCICSEKHEAWKTVISFRNTMITTQS